MRIAFFGTPAFAVPSLRALLADGASVVGVITQPDRPHGRSRSRLIPPPVKQLALEHHLPVLQPDRPAGDLFLTTLRRLDPELGVVVAYGHILKPEVLAIPPLGMINVHASLLPTLRGAAPIPRAILEGHARTGITIMQMEAGLDSGPILHQVETPIAPWESGGALTERLADLGATGLLEALALQRAGRLVPLVQDHDAATYAPKIDRTTCRIIWSETAERVARQIRAFDPAPGAWTTFGTGQGIKLFGARPTEGGGHPGAIVSLESGLVVATGSGAVMVEEVQPEGKRRMTAEEWSRGRGASVGDRFA